VDRRPRRPYPAGTPGAMALVTDARARLVLASARAGLAGPHDSSYPRYDDPDGLRAEALFAREMGFSGKHAIHPAQLATLREAFQVTEAEVAEARRIVAAWEQAQAADAFVTSANGTLIDPPIARRAQQVLARAPRGPA
jgi:citrate lyase subunit beta / citryl-CoA lyase